MPFIDAPYEAEAQCAALEELGVVDGVVTNDSDVLLFGAKTVYRNMFRSDAHIELYTSGKILEHCGLDRDDLISLALLLGSDYTDGIRGVGYVRAAEIVSTFKPIGGLALFADWYAKGESAFDDADPPIEVAASARSMLRRLRPALLLPESFPDRHVIAAYRSPRVDERISRETQFVWSRPNFGALRQWTEMRFGWSEEHADQQLRLVLERYNAALGEPRQRTMPSFFGSVRPVVQRVDSARLKNAMRRLRGESVDEGAAPKGKAVKKQSAASGNKKRGRRSAIPKRAAAKKAKPAKKRRQVEESNDTLDSDGESKGDNSDAEFVPTNSEGVKRRTRASTRQSAIKK